MLEANHIKYHQVDKRYGQSNFPTKNSCDMWAGFQKPIQKAEKFHTHKEHAMTFRLCEQNLYVNKL